MPIALVLSIGLSGSTYRLMNHFSNKGKLFGCFSGIAEHGSPVKQKDLKKYLAIVDAFKSQEMQNSWDKIDL